MILLSPQELKIVNYLQQKKTINFSELFQFGKPNVKLVTIQRALRDLKRKYKEAGIEFPKCEIKFAEDKVTAAPVPAPKKVQAKESDSIPILQKLVQVKKPETIAKETMHPFQADFKLNYNRRQVITKNGTFTLDNIDDWDLIKYFHKNPTKTTTMEDLKDLYWHNFGSKTPSRWMDAITRRVNNLRRVIPDLNGRIVTVPDQKQGTYFLVK